MVARGPGSGWTTASRSHGLAAVPANSAGVVFDGTYRRAVGEYAWTKLDSEVRRRFSEKPAGEACIRFVGTMHRVSMSRAGWLFAQACRAIGTPITIHEGTDVPVDIRLRPDPERGGVAWHRTYRFAGQREFTVSSTKCLDAKNDIVEHIGRGFRMLLKLTVENHGLVFRSIRYEVQCLGHMFRIPSWLTPGQTTVTHHPCDSGRFRFTLRVVHPLLGETFYQEGVFYSPVRSR